MSDIEIWLYGSSARGDRDQLSDVDLLVIGEGEVDLGGLGLPSRERISASRYGWEEIEQMASYGSLFLHHIRVEGQPILETREHRLRGLLYSLGPYARAERELTSFSMVLDDVERSLEGDYSVPFELSVVATALRHATILGCYLAGEPNFGHASAFKALLPKLGYSNEFIDEAIWLYSFRRADDDGRVRDATASSADVKLWVERVRLIIEQVGAIAR